MPITFQDRYETYDINTYTNYDINTYTNIDLDPYRASIDITADGLYAHSPSINTSTAAFQTALSDEIEKLVKRTVKQYLEEEGFILGRLPDEKEAEKAFDKIFEQTDE